MDEEEIRFTKKLGELIKEARGEQGYTGNFDGLSLRAVLNIMRFVIAKLEDE